MTRTVLLPWLTGADQMRLRCASRAIKEVVDQARQDVALGQQTPLVVDVAAVCHALGRHHRVPTAYRQALQRLEAVRFQELHLAVEHIPPDIFDNHVTLHYWNVIHYWRAIAATYPQHQYTTLLLNAVEMRPTVWQHLTHLTVGGIFVRAVMALLPSGALPSLRSLYCCQPLRDELTYKDSAYYIKMRQLTVRNVFAAVSRSLPPLEDPDTQRRPCPCPCPRLESVTWTNVDGDNTQSLRKVEAQMLKTLMAGRCAGLRRCRVGIHYSKGAIFTLRLDPQTGRVTDFLGNGRLYNGELATHPLAPGASVLQTALELGAPLEDISVRWSVLPNMAPMPLLVTIVTAAGQGQLRQLQSLELLNCGMNTALVTRLARAWGSGGGPPAALQRLDLSFNPLGDDGGRHLFESALVRAPHLEHLGLINCQLGTCSRLALRQVLLEGGLAALKVCALHHNLATFQSPIATIQSPIATIQSPIATIQSQEDARLAALLGRSHVESDGTRVRWWSLLPPMGLASERDGVGAEYTVRLPPVDDDFDDSDAAHDAAVDGLWVSDIDSDEDSGDEA